MLTVLGFEIGDPSIVLICMFMEGNIAIILTDHF